VKLYQENAYQPMIPRSAITLKGAVVSLVLDLLAARRQCLGRSLA